MQSLNVRHLTRAAGLLLAVALAPAAQAEGVQPSRDTGVGSHIAAQGDRALELIRAEAGAAVRAARPQLPEASRVVRTSQPAGATVATGAAVQCAE